MRKATDKDAIVQNKLFEQFREDIMHEFDMKIVESIEMTERKYRPFHYWLYRLRRALGFIKYDFDEYVDTLGIQQIADSDFSYITNSTEIHFPEALEEWGTFEYFAIYDRATGGTPKYIGALKSPLTVVENSVPLIRKNGLRIISY